MINIIATILTLKSSFIWEEKRKPTVPIGKKARNILVHKLIMSLLAERDFSDFGEEEIGNEILQNAKYLREDYIKNERQRLQTEMKKAEEETGEKKVYLVNCTAETEEMLRRIKFVEQNGGNYIMLDIITLGWAGLQTARNHTKLPIHAHRAGHAMFDRNPEHGMSMEVIAQLARMVGIDTLHIGTAYGKMTGGKDEVLHIEQEIESEFTKQTKEHLSQKWFGVKPVFGVASGGVHPGIVDKIMQFMSKDVVIQAGGGIHGHPQGTIAGAKAMRQAVDATMNKISLKNYAKSHRELREALEKWVK
nr:RuBisCO long chain, Form III-b [uncultured archaeon]